MTENRTLDNLRSSLEGKIYIYLNDEATASQFLLDADAEGYRFNRMRPIECQPDDIIALERGKQLACVGFTGRMAIQCSGGSNGESGFHVIDYSMYRNGNRMFRFCRLPKKI